MKHLKVVTWARWKVADPYDDRYYINFTASILKPTFEAPVPCASMSVVTAAGRVFTRFKNLADLRALFVVPDEYIGRLEEGYREAVRETTRIQTHLKMMMKAGGLEPGSFVVRTDTGEILAQAERILKEHDDR